MSEKKHKAEDFFNKLEENIDSIVDGSAEIDISGYEKKEKVEKRKHQRFEFKGPIFVHCVDPSYSAKGLVRDINEVGGLGILVEDDKLAIGHEVLVEFVGATNVLPFNIRTEVVNVFPEGDKYKAGLKILQLSKVTLKRIKEYIDDLIQHDVNWGR